MVAYSFKERFVEPILTGRKAQTIRAVRVSGHAAPGQAMQLYKGMRTRQCRLILRTRCIGSSAVQLRFAPVIEIHVGGERLAVRELDDFARADGFDDFSEMEAFWAASHPNTPVFDGVLIRWAPPPGPVEMGSDVEAG